MLLGRFRIAPSPPAGLFPFLFDPSSGLWRDPLTCVSAVSFTHRPRTSGGAFYDYSARYGAVRDEDRVTLRESMFSDPQSEDMRKHFNQLADTLGLIDLLDLPLVALSNGQTRRARILKALLSNPELLLLDEPLSKYVGFTYHRIKTQGSIAGLDVHNRSTILSLLRSLHSDRNPRIIMSLRAQDPMPDWISHIALVSGRQVTVGPKAGVLASEAAKSIIHSYESRAKTEISNPQDQPIDKTVVVELKNVCVTYQDRRVSCTALFSC